MQIETKTSTVPKKGRKYPTKDKTTTPEGRREYSKYAMREYRKRKAEKLKKMEEELKELRKKLLKKP